MLSLQKVRELIYLPSNRLYDYLINNQIDDISARYILINAIFILDKTKMKVINRVNWFTPDMINKINEKKNYFLILYIHDKFSKNITMPKEMLLNIFVNILEEHSVEKFYKYFKEKHSKQLIDVKDSLGRNLLFYITLQCDMLLFKFLSEKGFEKNIVDTEGKNVFDTLTLFNNNLIDNDKKINFINFLIANNIDINNSQIKEEQRDLTNRSYMYYQTLVREKNLNKILISNDENKTRKKI